MADLTELRAGLHQEAYKLQALADLTFIEDAKDEEYELPLHSVDSICGFSMLLGDIAARVESLANKMQTFGREKPKNGKGE